MIWVTAGIMLGAIGYAVFMIRLLHRWNREPSPFVAPADQDEAVQFTAALNDPLSR